MPIQEIKEQKNILMETTTTVGYQSYSLAEMYTRLNEAITLGQPLALDLFSFGFAFPESYQNISYLWHSTLPPVLILQ